MRKLALMFGALGFIAFTGLAQADDKTESSVKTESGTTISGKHKNVKTSKKVAADGTTTETKTEVVTPKAEKRDMDSRRNGETRDNGVAPVRHDEPANANSEVSEKNEEHTTLTGKKQMKSTKKVEKADGTTSETTTTTTEPKTKTTK